MKSIPQMIKYPFLYCTMGTVYVLIELLWRGYSHISMFALAGVCGVLIGMINEILPRDTPLWIQMSLSTAIILTGEFFSGCVLNLWLGLDIWDYSDVPFNLLGQICLPYTVAWFFLSLAAILLDDYLRYWLFREEKPYYCWKFRSTEKNPVQLRL